MAKTKKAPVAKAAPIPFADAHGTLLKEGDTVKVISDAPAERSVAGQTGKVESFTAHCTCCYVLLNGVGRLLACTDVEVVAPAEEPRRDGPWLDCNGHRLQGGWAAKVVPDASKALSGKLVNIIGLYEPASRSIEVQVIEGGSFARHRILPSLLEWVAGGKPAAEPVAAEPVPVEPETDLPYLVESATPKMVLSVKAWDLLEIIETCGGEVPFANVSGDSSQATVAELEAAGLVEVSAIGFRLTAAGQVAAKQEPELPPTPLSEAADAHKFGLRVLSLDSITVTRNTRKVFDEAALAELAESIKAHGVLQPIVVRPMGELKFELVAGERRYRAALLAGLEHLPATVRTLTDREFLEVQLLENLQRVDVRPADEAQAFAELLKNGYSAEEIGLKVGKGAKFVAQRAKLAALMPFWLDALTEDRLPLVAATEIARLPDESQARLEEVALRDYALKQPGALFKADWVKTAIRNHVLRDLNAAAFHKHDAQLCPAAGACTSCPKRSGAVKQLFDEEELKHDYCLDGACFEQKKEAFVVQQCATLRKATGQPAVRISSNYYQVPKGTLDCYSYKEVKEGTPEAVQAVLVDGSQMGQLKWVVITKLSSSAKSEADKEADAKRLRSERLTKTHRTLIAEKLTTDLPQSLATQSPIYESILTYLLLEECSSAKETLAYLRESWGWEPSEAALKDDYNDKDARGFRPWKRFVLEMVGPLSQQQKLEMYLALKVRHRMSYDYEDRQFTIAKLVAGHGYPELAAEAEQAVELRYYTRKGKKQEVPA